MNLNRNELREFMNYIDKGIRKKSVDEQKQIILQKSQDILNYLNDKNPFDCYSIDRQKKFLSGRQIGTFKNSILCLDNKQYLDAYWEIFDFIDDYGNKDNQVNIGEYDLFVLQLERMIKNIKES